RIYVSSLSGRLTPLAQLASVRFERSVPEIQRYHRERMVTISSNVRTGFNTDRVTKEILGRQREVHLPAGYRIMAAGEIESRQNSFGGIGSAIIVAVFPILPIPVVRVPPVPYTPIVAH